METYVSIPFLCITGMYCILILLPSPSFSLIPLPLPPIPILSLLMHRCENERCENGELWRAIRARPSVLARVTSLLACPWTVPRFLLPPVTAVDRPTLILHLYVC